MRGHEPGGKNQSTEGSSVGGRPMKAELNGEQLQGANGDGCLGTVKDRPAVCASFMTGLDDGPWLPGCAPRKKRKRKSAAEHRAARAKAWAARRQKLGPKGHR
jgi:hypothetical protein